MSESLKKRLVEIFKRGEIPECEEYINVLDKVNNILTNENESVRPYDKSGLPGGLIYLKKDIPTIIIPDLHARLNLFLSVMFYPGIDEESIIDKLSNDKIQIICVGDGFHAESRAIERWKKAFEEYKIAYKKHKYIDEEMTESLGIMEMVMEMKNEYPDNFHFLKGNHENITNENGNGNFPFRKFAYEGPMVLEYINQFYGEEFLEKYYNFEKNLPLFVIGKNFLVSHAEPVSFYSKEEIIEYRSNPDLIVGFTWTDNDASEEGSVNQMIETYLDTEYHSKAYYFGGHRPVPTLYKTRAEGRYVQIHNPNKFVIGVIMPDKEIDLDTDIIELEDNSNNIIKNF